MKRIHINDALEAHQRNDFPQAEAMYNQFLNQNPDSWYILFLLATLYMQVDKNGVAINLFQRAAQLNKDAPEIWNNMGTAYRKEHDNKNAERCLLQSIKVRRRLRKKPPPEANPEALTLENDADTFSNLGTLHINEGEPKKAEKYLRQALEVKKDHFQAHWNLGLALLEQGKWAEGFQEYEWGMKTDDRKSRHNWIPLWKGERKKSVIVYGEQGIGDEIMFSSIIPDMQKDVDEVIFECHPRLINMFKRSFPGIRLEPTRKKEIIDWECESEAKLPIGNLGTIYRRDDSHFPRTPYIIPDPKKVEKMRKKLEAAGPGPYIGIGWKGGGKSTRKDLRSIDLNEFKDLVSLKGTWVSLQYTPEAAEQVRDFNQEHGLNLHHWPAIVYADDYDETLALVAALDLVIHVNGSVVHLAGAMGKECWTLTPWRHAWRYASPDEGMIWYSSVKQYRQTREQDGNWEPILKQVRKDYMDFYKRKIDDLNNGRVSGTEQEVA